MRYGSVCSGIEAASVAWHPLGWEAAWLAEIEPFPSAVLGHHYPSVPNYGDMTALAERVSNLEIEAPDVLVGGTPCQAFSVAGLRQSLDDDRGQLTIKFLELADAIDNVRRTRGEPECIIVWENVPGVLSTKDNALGCFLAGLAGESEPLLPAGGKWSNAGCVFGPARTVAWRVLDAQYFGVAQRRRRVFVVASARDDFNPAAVLFEFDGLRRDIAPSRAQRKDIAGGVAIGPSGGCLTDLNPTLDSRAKDGPVRNQLAGAVLQSCGQDPAVATFDRQSYGEYGDQPIASTISARDNKSPTDLVVQPIPYRITFCDANGTRKDRPNGGLYISQPDFSGTLTRAESDLKIVQPMDDLSPNLTSTDRDAVASAVCFQQNTRDEVRLIGGEDNLAGALAASAGMKQTNYIAQPIPINSMTIQGRPSDDGRMGSGIGELGDPCPTFTKCHSHTVACLDVAGTMKACKDSGGWSNSADHAAAGYMQPVGMQVRRLTPTECERLQGFPDGYTQVPHRGKPAADGPRYKSLGNSMAVPVMAWIGRRIDQETKLRETT